MVYNICLAICGIGEICKNTPPSAPPPFTRGWISTFYGNNVLLPATGLSALCYDFYSFAVYGSVYGFTIGAYVGLTSVILVDLLGLDHLTNAFGLLLLFQGIASLIGPPIAGDY